MAFHIIGVCSCFSGFLNLNLSGQFDNIGKVVAKALLRAMLKLPGWGWRALGLIDGNEALAIFGLGQFLLGYVDAQDAVFELSGNVVF